MKYDLEKLIEAASLGSGIDKDLIKAIIQIESSGYTFAVRYEPNYPHLYYPRELASKCIVSVATMENIQKTSWGLMQVMGGTAYWLGFPKNKLVTELCMPHIGIEYGVKYLKKLFLRYNQESDVIAAYNRGSAIKVKSGFYENQGYVDKVHGELVKLRRIKE